MGDGDLITSSCCLGLGAGKERWAGSGEERCAASGTGSIVCSIALSAYDYEEPIKIKSEEHIHEHITKACNDSSIGLEGSHIRKFNKVFASGPALLAFSLSICANAASKEWIRLWRPVARCSRWEIKVSRFQHAYGNTNSSKFVILGNDVLFVTRLRLKDNMVHQVLLWVGLQKLK